MLYTTLTNPFGTAHPPLLFAAVSTTKIVILNAHPRIWRWRGEILGALCTCWLHVASEKEDREKATEAKGSPSMTELVKITRELQSAVYVLKHTLQNPAAVVNGSPDADQLHAKKEMQQELQALVEADSELQGLLFADVKA